MGVTLGLIDGLSAVSLCGAGPARGDNVEGVARGLVSGVGTSMCGGEKGVGGAARGEAGACTTSTGLSIDDEIGGKDGDGALVGKGEAMGATGKLGGDSIAAGNDCGVDGRMGVDVSGGVGVTSSGRIGGADVRGVTDGNGCMVGVEMGAGVEADGIGLGIDVGR